MSWAIPELIKGNKIQVKLSQFSPKKKGKGWAGGEKKKKTEKKKDRTHRF